MVSVNDPIVKLFYHAKEMTILRNGTVGTRLIFLQSKLRSPYNRKLKLHRENSTSFSTSDENLHMKILVKP